MKEYKVGSLFAGVGGICLGFQNAKSENAKYKLLWANEIDEYACATYKNNFKHTLLQGDITCYGLADFNRYIDFLYNKGVSVDLVNSFSKLYSNLYPNENPYKFLDLVDDNWGKVYSKKFFNSRI